MTIAVARVQQWPQARPRGQMPDLTWPAAELVAMLDLKTMSYRPRPAQELISESKHCSSVFLILEGMALRYRILRNGQRQIINFLVPGDFAGVTSSHFDNAPFSMKTLTPSLVAQIPVARLQALFETQPRLAQALWGLFSLEAAILGEHLISLGRRPAASRVAHFLLELHVRLRRVGLADKTSYRLPLTQEMISDALGLSIPYLNQVLQELRAERLVTVKDRMVVIENWEDLAVLADFKHTYLQPLNAAA